MTVYLRAVPADQSAAAIAAADQVLGAGETWTEPTPVPGHVRIATSSRHEGQPPHTPGHHSLIAEAEAAIAGALRNT